MHTYYLHMNCINAEKMAKAHCKMYNVFINLGCNKNILKQKPKNMKLKANSKPL